MTPTRRSIAIQIAALVVAAVAGGMIASTVGDRHSQLSSTEIGFAQDMSAHHSQAITLADMLSPDATLKTRALADQIRASQLREIGMMTGWLQVVGAPLTSPAPMLWMADHSAHHTGDRTATMAGMASPADLRRLQALTGSDNEKFFLQLMTRHHEGGIQMAVFAARKSSTDFVRRTAVDMIDEQTGEVQLMTVLLEEQHCTPLPYP